MKRTFIKILAAALFMLVIMQACVCAVDFPDVSRYHNNYKAISYLVDLGVVSGYETGEFCPEREITRTEFCALVARTMGFNQKSYKVKKLPFSDVPDEYWGIGFISYCYEKNLINGMGNGKFAPAEKVTVAQAVKIAVCAAGLESRVKRINGKNWYDGYIKVADNYGFLDKVTQNAQENAVRANTAQVVYNMIRSGMVEVDEPVYEPEDTDVSDSTDEKTEDKTETEIEDKKPVKEPESTDGVTSEIDGAFNQKDYSEISVIVIDAGHNYSGYDKGAYNEELDVSEEVLTWQMADKLREKLEAEGYEVVMTRENLTDNVENSSLTASLQARVDIANKALADLYISIHCNMGGGKGTETYCFSLGGYSARIAGLVQENITEDTGLYNRGVKTAGFYVIKNTVMPAILIETGFMDNVDDVEFLISEEGQELIAQAVADAVVEYDSMAPIIEEQTEKKSEEQAEDGYDDESLHTNAAEEEEND